MSKLSLIVKNKRREQMSQRYREIRNAIRAKRNDRNSSIEERFNAQKQFHKLPRDSACTRIRNRDKIDGRPRGYIRKFAMSRINVRRLANEGILPGIKKSSW